MTMVAVLSPYDGLSIGIISSLRGVGYGSDDLPMPIISGQDAEIPSVKAIIAGDQYSTIFKDTRELARVTVGMVLALLSDAEPEINDTETYDNGVKVVPSYLLNPVLVTGDNWEDVLLDRYITRPDRRLIQHQHSAWRPVRRRAPDPCLPRRAIMTAILRCAASRSPFRA